MVLKREIRVVTVGMFNLKENDKVHTTSDRSSNNVAACLAALLLILPCMSEAGDALEAPRPRPAYASRLHRDRIRRKSSFGS